VFLPLTLSPLYPRLQLHNLAYVVLKLDEALSFTILDPRKTIILLSRVINSITNLKVVVGIWYAMLFYKLCSQGDLSNYMFKG
jgi:hypothetical protein